MPESTVSNDTLDKEIILHHIDKYYETLTRVWDSINRILFAEVALSLIILALSTDAVSVGEDFEIIGLNFKLSIAVFLSGGAVLIAALYISFFSQLVHADNLKYQIYKLYESIGYMAPSVQSVEVDAFEISNVYVSLIATTQNPEKTANRLISGFNTFIGGVTVLGVLILIPVSAQIAAALKVSALLGRKWQVLVPFAGLVFLTTCSLIVKMLSAPQHPSERRKEAERKHLQAQPNDSSGRTRR